MRLFVAAELPETMSEALAETSALLRGRVRGRYVSPDSFHVTLAFLGEVQVARVDSAAATIEEGCAGFAPIDVSLGELGSFGRRSSATLWQGFRRDDELVALAQSVRRCLQDAAFVFDAKPFRAHVTLMRAADVREGVLSVPVFARGTIERVSLFKSDLTGTRPVYEALHTVHLR